MRTRRHELNQEDRRYAFSIDRKPGETVASLHRRKAQIMRKANFHVFTYNFNFDAGRNCMLCWFGVNIYMDVTIETSTGKVSGLICEECAKKISERLDAAIEKTQERVRREAAKRGDL